MSLVPCDRHGHAVPGRVVGTYPSVVLDGTRYSRKLRLCDECLTELLADRQTEWIDVSIGVPTQQDPKCSKCGDSVVALKDLQTFWFTAYVSGKYRRDYRAWYCRSCAETTIVSLELETASN